MKRLLAFLLIGIFFLVGCQADTPANVTPTNKPVETVTATDSPVVTNSPIVKETDKPKDGGKKGRDKNGKKNRKDNGEDKSTPSPTKRPASPKPTKKPKATKKPDIKKTPKPTNTPKPTGKVLYINEICGSNGQVVQDENGKFEDWFEIYNAGDKDINLKGYYVTDNADKLTKYQLPDVTVKAKGHIIIWCSGKDYVQANGQVHTNFKINIEGEPILLVAPDGTKIIDQFESKAFVRDTSYGRITSGGTKWGQFNTPTPGKAN